MKKNLQKMFGMLLAGCFLFAAIGCGMVPNSGSTASTASSDPIIVTDNGDSDTQNTEPGTSVQEPAAVSDPAAPTVSDAEIMRLFWELEDQYFSAANAGNYEAFKSMYYDTDENVIQSDYQTDWSKYSGYDKHDGFVVCSENGYYLIADAYYIVSGSYPNTHRSSTDGYKFVHYADGKLQFAYGQEANDTLAPLFTAKLVEFFNRVSPGFEEELNSASNSGNFINNNYMFLNSDFAYTGSNDATLIFLWQTENGDVKAAVWYANGTDQNISSETQITITDDSLGTVFDVWVDGTVATRSHHSQVKVFTIPAGSVRTGTQIWTSMSSHVHTSNTP